MVTEQDSPLVEYVIDNIPKYELLNAANSSEGEIAFLQALAQQLPPISALEEEDHLQMVGHYTKIYKIHYKEHLIYIKTYKQYSDTPAESKQAAKESWFKQERECFNRAKLYISEFLPVTLYVDNEDEKFIVQDFVAGVQLKAMKHYPEKLKKLILTPNQKAQVLTLIAKLTQMKDETGYIIWDLDVMFSDNSIAVFDTGSQTTTNYAILNDTLKDMFQTLNRLVDNS